MEYESKKQTEKRKKIEKKNFFFKKKFFLKIFLSQILTAISGNVGEKLFDKTSYTTV